MHIVCLQPGNLEHQPHIYPLYYGVSVGGKENVCAKMLQASDSRVILSYTLIRMHTCLYSAIILGKCSM